MTFQQELNSWMSPTSLTTFPAPEIGSRAPLSDRIPFPAKNGKPTLISFLRHCGCPFAEKTFHTLRSLASKHKDINFIAVSHSDEEATEKWIISVGGAWDVEVIVDPSREIYAQWGLGVSSVWHVLNPWSMWSVYRLGSSEGIRNRPTESGSRWQTSGSWAVDGMGVVRWGGVAKAADDMMDLAEGVRVLEEGGKKEGK